MRVEILTGLVFFVVLGLPYVAALFGWVTIRERRPSTTHGRYLFLALVFVALILSLWMVDNFVLPLVAVAFGAENQNSPSGVVPVAGLFLLLIMAIPVWALQAVGGVTVRAIVGQFLSANRSSRSAAPASNGAVAMSALAVSLAVGAALTFARPAWFLGLMSPIWLASRQVALVPHADAWMLSVAGITVALVLVIAAFATPPSAEEIQYLPRYDTQLRIYATYFLLTTLISFAGLASYRAFAFEESTGSLFALSVGAIMAGPAIVALLAYLIAPSMVRRTCRATKGKESDFLKELRNSCTASGITSPEYLTSSIPFASPQVFGTFTRSWVIVPQNIDAVFTSVGQWAGPDVASALRTFVVSHEFAHLRYKDYRFFTWLTVYLRLLLRFWLPVYAIVLVLFSVANVRVSEASLSRSVLIGYAVLIPIVMVTLLYALTLTILRDRELLADRWAFRVLEPDRRTHLFEPKLAGTSLGPLMVLMQLFRAGPGLAVGTALEENTSTTQSTWHWLKSAYRWIARRVLPRHPPTAARIEAIREDRDALLDSQSSLENGVFAGAILALLYLLWGGATFTFGIPPGNELNRASEIAVLLVAAGILGIVFAAPIRHSPRVDWTFSEYNWIQVRKALFTALSAWCVLILVGLPAMSLPQASYLWRILLAAGAGAYVFGLLGAIDVVRQGRTSWSPHAIWHIPLLVMIGLLIALPMGLGFGLLLVPIAFFLAAGFRLPLRRAK